jgi:hypothetical protein
VLPVRRGGTKKVREMERRRELEKIDRLDIGVDEPCVDRLHELSFVLV